MQRNIYWQAIIEDLFTMAIAGVSWKQIAEKLLISTEQARKKFHHTATEDERDAREDAREKNKWMKRAGMRMEGEFLTGSPEDPNGVAYLDGHQFQDSETAKKQRPNGSRLSHPGTWVARASSLGWM